MEKEDRQTANPLQIKGFPICLYYAIRAHLHKQSVVRRGKAERCAGTSRTLRCQYHNEHLRSLYKGSEAHFRKAAG